MLHSVPTESTTSAEVHATYTMVERPALLPLILIACLLPTMSASAIAAAVVGVATSSPVVERASKIISVTLPARNLFWSALHRKANRTVDVSLLN